MITEVDIVNSGLSKIGAEPIMSLDDDSKEARSAKNRFALVRDVVLRMHPWNCATERVELAPLTDTPDFGYDYYFQIPSDCLRILLINPEDNIDYRIEGRMIATDTDAVELKYVKRLEDTTLLDPLCAEAIGAYLAWDISYRITQDDSVTNRAWEVFQLILRRAKAIDAQEDPLKSMEADLWVDARQNFTDQPLRGDR